MEEERKTQHKKEDRATPSYPPPPPLLPGERKGGGKGKEVISFVVCDPALPFAVPMYVQVFLCVHDAG